MRQLPLQISAPAEPRFENYLAGANIEALARIRALAAGSLHEAVVYLWGEPGSGRTHLLRAAAHANPELFIADDVETLDAAAQQALFVAINAARDGQAAVLAAGTAPPAQLLLREDLRSRLAWGLVYQLKPLTDAEKALYLRAEAERRGLRLSDEVVWYLLNHLPRDLGSLHRVLEVLDRYSLASQRAVTLPLVREALSAAQDGANCLDKPGRPE
ncbi:MAG TPA: DnaA/Hda family protein [Burkholderiales bacterium]|nr:DnaA/Hda family protein [Burkholderiales bacterium]